MKKIFITGVAGMIGSHLLDALIVRNVQIVGIDNLSYGKMENIEHHLSASNFKFHHIDINDLKMLKLVSKDSDVIFHLAAVKKIDEFHSSMSTLFTNVHGTENIFRVAHMWESKVIFASTSDVYGMSPDVPFSENGNSLLGPSMIKRWSYAVSKLYCEQLAYMYYKDFSIPMVILRYFGGFSPRSSFTWSGGHIPIFINQILRNKPVTIHGDGSQTRSMAYVDDLVRGTISAMDSERAVGEIINLGNDEELSVLNTADLIYDIAKTGKDQKYQFIPMKDVFGSYKDIMRRKPDLQKAKYFLEYEPKISLREGIKKVIDKRKREWDI